MRERNVYVDKTRFPSCFCRGRLRHGRHFTFQASNSDIAITLVSASVAGSIATKEHPYSACGNWLQVCHRMVTVVLVRSMIFVQCNIWVIPVSKRKRLVHLNGPFHTQRSSCNT